jgi:cell division protein FtsW
MMDAVSGRSSTLPDFDYTLLWVVLLLLGFGLVMVYSASIAIAEAASYTRHQTTYFLIRHAIYIAGSLAAGWVIYQIPPAALQRWAPYLFLASIFLLVVVLLPGIGKEVNGSRRWLSFGFFTLQPSELMKLVVVLYAADYTVRKAELIKSFGKGFLPMLLVMLLIGGLLLQQPDFGAFAVIVTIALSILFLGGVNLRHFIGLAIVLGTGFLTLIVSSPYRMQRILGFMDPWADPWGRGYQLSHALIAFGRGEWWGVGLGASVEKLLYLPEAHTDFLMAVIAEELGFVVVLTVILIFAWLTWRACRIGMQAQKFKQHFSALCAYGIGVWLGVQAMINIGVNTGVLPTKGLTLPLMSYGGSGILVNCMAMAIVLRIARENRCALKGGRC